MVIDSMDCLFQKLPELRIAYDEKFKDNSDSRRHLDPDGAVEDGEAFRLAQT